MPINPAGGASDAATSTPTAAPETRLLRSDCTRFNAPAAPAINGKSTATEETSLLATICSVATFWDSNRLSSPATQIVTARAAR